MQNDSTTFSLRSQSAPQQPQDNNTQAATSKSPSTPAQSTASPGNTPSEETIEQIMNNLTDQETIDLFIRGIMEEKGVRPQSEEMRQDLIDDLKAQLLEQIDRSLVAELPDDQLEELNQMAIKNGEIPPELVAQKIAEANLNTNEIIGVTMNRFREIYLGQNTNSPASNLKQPNQA